MKEWLEEQIELIEGKIKMYDAMLFQTPSSMDDVYKRLREWNRGKLMMAKMALKEYDRSN